MAVDHFNFVYIFALKSTHIVSAISQWMSLTRSLAFKNLLNLVEKIYNL